MYTFKKGIKTAGIVFCSIAIVLMLGGTVTSLIAYSQTSISSSVYVNLAVNTGISLFTLVSSLVVLVRSRKDILAGVLLAIQALLALRSVTSIVTFPLSGINAILLFLVMGLVALDCFLDLKLQPKLKKLLMGGGMAFQALLAAVSTLVMTLTSYSRAGLFERTDFINIVMLLLPTLMGIVFSIPTYGIRIITALCVAGTNKVPKDGAPAPQQPQYQGQQYQQPQYQGQQYQTPQYQAPQYQQPQYQAPQQTPGQQ